MRAFSALVQPPVHFGASCYFLGDGLGSFFSQPSPAYNILLLKNACLCLAVPKELIHTDSAPILNYWLISGNLCHPLAPQYFERFPSVFGVLRVVTWLLRTRVSFCFTFTSVFVYSLAVAVFGAARQPSWCWFWQMGQVRSHSVTLHGALYNALCDPLCQTINCKGIRSHCASPSHLFTEL